MAAPNVSREHRPFFRFRFPFSVVPRPSCQQFRTLFRSSFRLQTKIPYLIHSRVHFPLFFLGFVHSRIFRLSVFSAFSGFQGSRSGIPVFSVFSAFSGFQGSKSGIPVFPFFPLFRAPNPEFRGHGSGHVWCGHVWRAPMLALWLMHSISLSPSVLSPSLPVDLSISCYSSPPLPLQVCNRSINTLGPNIRPSLPPNLCHPPLLSHSLSFALVLHLFTHALGQCSGQVLHQDLITSI